MINIKQTAEKIGQDIIEFDNINNLSLNEIFTLLITKYSINDILENKILVKVISYLSNCGYDIVSTHPLKLKKYK